MKSDLWTIISGGGFLALLWQLLKVLRQFLKERNSKKTEAAPGTSESSGAVESKREVSYLSSLTFVFAIAFGLCLVVAFSHEQTGLIPRLLAAGVGGLGLLGWVIQVLVKPAYERTLALEDQHLDLEERLKLLERERLTTNNFLKDEFSIPRKPFVRKTQPRQQLGKKPKRDSSDSEPKPAADENADSHSEPKRKPSSKSTKRPHGRNTRKKKNNSE